MDGGGSGHWPILLIELVLVFGGVLAFGWWQLRGIERDRREAARRRADEARDAAADPPAPAGPAPPAAGRRD